MAILPGSGPGNVPESKSVTKYPAGLAGLNQEPFLGLRRILQLDSATRVASQIEHDRGAYVRPAVGPVEYSEGNIKKSTALVGPAGYNQKTIPLKDSPDDMSQEQYMLSVLQDSPTQRSRMQADLVGKTQNFLNTQLQQTDYPTYSHNTVDNLMSLAKAKLQQKK